MKINVPDLCYNAHVKKKKYYSGIIDAKIKINWLEVVPFKKKKSFEGNNTKLVGGR